jgi:hypothetical protein
MVTETMTKTRRLPTTIVVLVLVVALPWIQSSFAQRRQGQSDQLSATKAKSTKQKAQRIKKKTIGLQRSSGNHSGRTSKGQRPREGKTCEEPTSKPPLFCSQ